jgi:putative transposase
MRKGRFSEEQMVAIIREADRGPVVAVAKRHGVSEQTIYTWRKRFGSLQSSDVKRLRQLKADNARLQVPRKRPRKRIAAARPRPQAPTGPNQVWSYDFVFDYCANGQQLKCLTVTDEFTRDHEARVGAVLHDAKGAVPGGV